MLKKENSFVSAIPLIRIGNQLFIRTAHVPCEAILQDHLTWIYQSQTSQCATQRLRDHAVWGTCTQPAWGPLTLEKNGEMRPECHPLHPHSVHPGSVKEIQEDRQGRRPRHDLPLSRGPEDRDHGGDHGACLCHSRHATNWQSSSTEPLNSSGLNVSALLKSCCFLEEGGKKSFP